MYASILFIALRNLVNVFSVMIFCICSGEIIAVYALRLVKEQTVSIMTHKIDNIKAKIQDKKGIWRTAVPL